MEKIIHYLKIINHKLFFKHKLHTFPNIVLIFVRRYGALKQINELRTVNKVIVIA